MDKNGSMPGFQKFYFVASTNLINGHKLMANC